MFSSIENDWKESQSKNIAYQWHWEEEQKKPWETVQKADHGKHQNQKQINEDRQHTINVKKIAFGNKEHTTD